MARGARRNTCGPCDAREKGSRTLAAGSYAGPVRLRPLALVSLLSLPLLAFACAEAGEEGLEQEDPVSTPPGAGDSGTTTRSDGGPATPPKGSSSSSGSVDGGGSSGSSSGGIDAGTDGGSDGGSSGGCTEAVCSAATDLGEINGDTGSDSVTTQGTSSKWVAVFVKDTAFGSVEISYSLTFVPPPGVDYELRIADAKDATCSSTTAVIPPARYGSHENDWTDAELAVNDGHQLYVYVKQTSGACPASAPWKLTIQGNTYEP